MAHLTTEQRYKIQVLHEKNYALTEIAKEIGKDKSVVSREIRRNKDPRSGTYKAALAQYYYTQRLHSKPKSSKFTETIATKIRELLPQGYSPEQIVGRCRLKGFPCVSCERIYQYIWADKRQNGNLYTYLRRHGRRYRKRGAAKDLRGILRDQVSIDLRPKIVDEKLRFGDLEMDTVIGRNHKGALLTINDRVTKLCWIFLLKSRDSHILSRTAIEGLSYLKDKLKTITVDNGKEFAQHKTITEALGIPIFFAHPYHSWERGANENMNGLIRQYARKGSSFEDLTEDAVRQIQELLNNRPRKSLGYLTPKEYALLNFGISI